MRKVTDFPNGDLLNGRDEKRLFFVGLFRNMEGNRMGNRRRVGRKQNYSRKMWQGGHWRLPRKHVWNNVGLLRDWCGSPGAAITCLCPACPIIFPSSAS